MKLERCDAAHDGKCCVLDHGHFPNTLHVALTPTSLTRWGSGEVQIDTWKRQSVPQALKSSVKCPMCRKQIDSRGHGQRYCGDECRKAARRESNQRNKINVRRKARRQAA